MFSFDQEKPSKVPFAKFNKWLKEFPDFAKEYAESPYNSYSEFLFRRWNPDSATSCISCGGETSFVSIKDGYKPFCHRCGIHHHHSKRFSQITEDQAKSIVLKNINTIKESNSPGRALSFICNQNPGLREFLRSRHKFLLVSFIRLVEPDFCRCKICGKDTTFISVDDYYHQCQRCSRPAIKQTKLDNNFKRVKEWLTSFEIEILSDPVHISKEKLKLKFPCGHISDFWITNGRCGKEPPKCPKCFSNNISKAEFEIKEWLENELGREIETQVDITKVGKGRRKVDIFDPISKIGIEYDGVMYHSFGHNNSSKFDNVEKEDRNLHLIKTEMAREQEIQLLHIFSNEWGNNPEIWKSVILAKMGKSEKVFARKTELREIDSKTARNFFEENHLQGSVNGSVRLGLFFENELIGAMSFGKARLSKEYQWELLRFASKKGITIVGGASKLLKHFVKHHNPDSIVSYANLRWSDGGLYKKLGFNFLRRSSPNYFKPSGNDQSVKLLSRNMFQKHKLCLSEDEVGLSESQIMFKRGFRRIWDCGNLVYFGRIKIS